MHLFDVLGPLHSAGFFFFSSFFGAAFRFWTSFLDDRSSLGLSSPHLPLCHRVISVSKMKMDSHTSPFLFATELCWFCRNLFFSFGCSPMHPCSLVVVLWIHHSRSAPKSSSRSPLRTETDFVSSSFSFPPRIFPYGTLPFLVAVDHEGSPQCVVQSIYILLSPSSTMTRNTPRTPVSGLISRPPSLLLILPRPGRGDVLVQILFLVM